MMDIAKLAGGLPDDKGIEVFWDKNSDERWNHLFMTKQESVGE
jgi:hypothetical protein